MLKEFNLSFKDEELDSKVLKHIQYNLLKKLSKLKYITYRRIDITLSVNQALRHLRIDWDDGKTSTISCTIEHQFNDLTSMDGIAEIYQNVSHCLIVSWNKNNWNAKDIQNIINEIISEKYFVSVTIGKNHSSLDRKYKVELVCEIHPLYAEYYLDVSEKGNSFKHRIHFLKGTPIIDLFFVFFTKHYWHDNANFIIHDFNKEIFFVFDIKRLFFFFN